VSTGLCLLVLVTLGAGDGRAQPLRPMLARTGVFTTDGQRYALYGKAFAPRVTVLDTRTGRRRSLALPDGCFVLVNLNLRWPAALGHVLVTCNDGTQRDADLRTGAIQALPRTAGWTNLGAAWAAGAASEGCAPAHACRAYVDLASGEMRHRPRSFAGDLDKPSLPEVPACAGLRNAARAPLDGPSSGQRLYEHRRALILHGPAGPDRSGLLLTGCHRQPLVLDRHAANWARLSGGVASWNTANDALLYGDLDHVHGGTLAAYSLTSRRVMRWRVPRALFNPGGEFPRIRGTIGESLHTANRVYWVVPKHYEDDVVLTDQVAVYSATMPVSR
jgi:hypothetical protein